jgi:hypothetical protein
MNERKKNLAAEISNRLAPRAWPAAAASQPRSMETPAVMQQLHRSSAIRVN